LIDTQSLANIFVRDDRRFFLEGNVSAGMIAVIVRVDHETHRLIGDGFQCGANLIGERRVLIIDDDNAVFADGSTDVAALTFQHINAAGNVCHFDLHVRELVLMSKRGASDSSKQ
jgi:hypothetical protein